MDGQARWSLGPFVRTSHEVHFAAGLCVPKESADYRVPAVRHGHRFRPRRRCLLFRPSPAPFGAGSFPRAACPLRSVLAFLPCAAFQRGPAMGFLPSSRRYRRCPLRAGFPNVPLRSVPRFSQPLDGLLHLRLRGLLSSRSHVQGFRTGVWSRPAAVPTRRRPCLPALAANALTSCPAATHPRPSFEAFIHESRRSPESAVNLRRCRSPLRFLLLQALSSASRPHATTAHGLRSWPCPRCVRRRVAAPAFAPWMTSSVSATRSLVARLRAHPPARGSCLPPAVHPCECGPDDEACTTTLL
jgi:hypothetical protein